MPNIPPPQFVKALQVICPFCNHYYYIHSVPAIPTLGSLDINKYYKTKRTEIKTQYCECGRHFTFTQHFNCYDFLIDISATKLEQLGYIHTFDIRGDETFQKEIIVQDTNANIKLTTITMVDGFGVVRLDTTYNGTTIPTQLTVEELESIIKFKKEKK